MLTKFAEMVKEENLDKYLYRMPDCDLPRMMKGDIIYFRRYKGSGIQSIANVRETWKVIVVEEPIITEFFAREHPDESAYDDGTVIPLQTVVVKILEKTYT